jgi:hypothetical protein
MTSRKALLNSLLRPLVQEWGHREVEAALAELSDAADITDRHRRSSSGPGGVQRTRRPTKLLASEQVERAQLPEAQKVALQELAMRFDRKQFLPSFSDVRDFLIMMGERPGAMKDRSQAFRLLLRALGELPTERLKDLASTAIHSGPSELGPLSDAISAAATSLPRHREPSAS